MNALIAYFSASGVTAKVAKRLDQERQQVKEHWIMK